MMRSVVVGIGLAVAFFLLLPWATVETVREPTASCTAPTPWFAVDQANRINVIRMSDDGEQIPGGLEMPYVGLPSVTPSWLPSNITNQPWMTPQTISRGRCATLSHQDQMAPLALLWFDGGGHGGGGNDVLAPALPGYQTHLRIVADVGFVLAPVASGLLALLVIQTARHYGDSWRAAARALVRPSRGRVVLTVLGIFSLWSFAFQAFVGDAHPYASDDDVAMLLLPVAPLWLVTNLFAAPVMESAFHAANAFAFWPSWGSHPFGPTFHASKEFPRALSVEGNLVAIALCSVAWYVVAGLMTWAWSAGRARWWPGREPAAAVAPPVSA